MSSKPQSMKCVICGRTVTEDNSFSNQYQNVWCCHCVDALSKSLGISVTKFVSEYVWPYTDDDVLALKRKLQFNLSRIVYNQISRARPKEVHSDAWCDAHVTVPVVSMQPERYMCHSRTRGVPIDGQGYVYRYWSRFENGMIVKPQVPVDFSGKTGGLVIVQRYYTEYGVEHLEDGRVAIPLDTFRKCFNKVER